MKAEEKSICLKKQKYNKSYTKIKKVEKRLVVRKSRSFFFLHSVDHGK